MVLLVEQKFDCCRGLTAARARLDTSRCLPILLAGTEWYPLCQWVLSRTRSSLADGLATALYHNFACDPDAETVAELVLVKSMAVGKPDAVPEEASPNDAHGARVDEALSTRLKRAIAACR